MHSDEVMPEISNPVQVHADVANSINYASWQNSVPLLRSLKISNASLEGYDNLRLEVRSSPGFVRPKRWIIDRVTPNSEIEIRDRVIDLDPDYLAGLNEAERGVVTFSLIAGENIIADHKHELRVLARDEWGGLNSGGELLAAFVMPNDPALARILKTAGEVLDKHGHSSALDGYQSGDPRRAYLLVAAIWSAVASKSLTYANPPRSFEAIGQKTRRPSTVVSEGLATCLDTTLLFAAAIEAVGLNPIITMVEGHCFVGAWLVERTLGSVIETDCSEIRKAIAGDELVTFETTLVTHRPPSRFQDAVKVASAATSEANERTYLATIDIARARMAQIRPLASHQVVASGAPELAEEQGPLPLPAAPSISAPIASDLDEKPATADGRIDRWQRKLLDLSLRNRLLNFKPNKQSVPIVCSDISLLEDSLANGRKLRLISLPAQNPLGERDAHLHRQKTNEDINIEFARAALARDEVACPISEEDLVSRLTTIYRNVRNDLAEGGSNTLFLAVGFLRWKKPEDAKYYRAPLLLVPVKLVRKSAVSPFQLSLHEDEVRFNATLIQLLKKDFDRDLSAFESDLPTDQSGVDVPKVLQRMRHAVREIPGFEVIDETALGTFSFAKYLMWKDLVERIDSLKNNRVVRHLIQNPHEPFESDSGGSIPSPSEVDIRYEPKDIYHPLPADSSQLAAVMAASEGQDYVLVGPPGTGKSQTIANIISQCLAIGKTVLFVAEKTAALDVVYRRLREHGLGDCCLELHSNKAERRKFLEQLDNAWQNNRKANKNDWLTISERLRVRRDELNAYVTAIHKVYPNGWTAFEALGTCVRGGDVKTPAFDWADSIQHDREAFQQLTSIVNELALTFGAIDSGVTLPSVNASQWSASWEQSLLNACESLTFAANELGEKNTQFCDNIGIMGQVDGSLGQLDGLHQLADALCDCAGEDVRLLFHKQFAKLPAAQQQLQHDIKSYNDARSSASANYDESLTDIPLDELDQSWRQAVASFWPMSWLGKRKIKRLLQTYASSGNADPHSDLAAIRLIRQHLAAINESPLADQSKHFRSVETDCTALERQLSKAHALRQAIVTAGKLFGETNPISKAIHPFIDGRSSDTTLYQAASQYRVAFEKYIAALKGFSEVAGRNPITKDVAKILNASRETARQIQENRTCLQRWTAWCRIREASKQAGLSSFVDALEREDFSASQLEDRFRLAYARWWIRRVIDGDDILRSFQRFRHEDAIKDFCELDDQARSTASARAKQAIAHELPKPEGVPRRSELGVLRHQIGLQRPSKSIREMIGSMPDAFGKLAPCLLMSPLSIAQYLPANQALFDVVIFDEASQITTWDAIGAIARGRQTIIVGDPKQLPPTNFFGRTDDDETNDELEDHEKDLESILDEAKASGLPTLQLNWHYRSRHESLIAFSNWNYYGNNLVTFPAAESEDRGVSLVHLPDAIYDRGKSRTNRAEAEAIVAEAVTRMKRNLRLPENQRLTFGVITFNSQQQSLIQDLFDQAQRDNPELDWFFADDRIEPTVVKNLENVQGDERDVMMFSITFGRHISGVSIPRTFGALNRVGGERRLNVAVTRARQELVVFSSFKADELNVEGINARGVCDLKAFLEYAEKGPEAIAARSDGSVGGFDSPFEEAVSSALEQRGWQVVSQVGVSGFRVDLGIVHPDKPGAYLAGVECDGATYHRSAVARDRDKIRQQVLENLGWNILRVWSPDWWYDANSAIEKVHGDLNLLLQNQRAEAEAKSADQSMVQADELANISESGIDDEGTYIKAESEATLVQETQVYYARVKLGAAEANQNRFYDSSYDDELRQMSLALLAESGPIRDDIFVKQIARAHGFARTGNNIRSRILGLLENVASTDEASGRFLWSSQTPESVIAFRSSNSEQDRRNIDEIPMAELIGLVQANADLLDEADPVASLSRIIGIARLSQQARDRLAEAITAFRNIV